MSLSAETHILMADATTKPISQVQVGDVVLATEPENGHTSPQTVTAVWIHDDTLVDLELANGAAITTTEDHPFWNATDHQWQQAQAITAGDQLLTPTGGHVAVTGLDRARTTNQTAYNLSVSNLHTYYVLAGTTPVLVHNDGGEPGPGQIYLWRAVLQPELDAIQGGRSFANPPGIETKYFSYSERGAAEFAKRMYAQFPTEGPYTIVRTTINVSDIPAGSVMPYTANVVDGGVALPSGTLSKLGRPRIMPSMSTGISC